MRWSERAPAARPRSLSLPPFPCKRRAPSVPVAHLVLVRRLAHPESMKVPGKRMTDALADYIDVLARGTRYTNDRPQFSGHLARAAEMFSAIHAGFSAAAEA